MLPILPTCSHCGEEVETTHRCNGGTIIVLNGTCGSGKSTIAEILAEKWIPCNRWRLCNSVGKTQEKDKTGRFQ